MDILEGYRRQKDVARDGRIWIMHERVWNDYAKIIEINENDEMMR